MININNVATRFKLGHGNVSVLRVYCTVKSDGAISMLNAKCRLGRNASFIDFPEPYWSKFKNDFKANVLDIIDQDATTEIDNGDTIVVEMDINAKYATCFINQDPAESERSHNYSFPAPVASRRNSVLRASSVIDETRRDDIIQGLPH